MKRISSLFIILMITTFSFSQTEPDDFPQHEVNLNIANTIAVASGEVGYEYFFAFNQAVGAKILINDRRNYREKSDEKVNTNSFRVNYTYYFGRVEPGSEFYVQPFMKYRFGDFKEEKDGSTVKTDMDAFMVGVGAGYVWNFSDDFVVGPFANIARNFSNDVKDRFSAIDWNAGINIGYRF